MSSDNKATTDLKRVRKNRGLQEAGAVIALVALALAAVWIAIDASIQDPDISGPREEPKTAAATLPARIPYEDLVKGSIERGEGGVVTMSYDFDPVAKQEGLVFTENDLIPQLEDWNLRLPGSRRRTSIIRGEWRLRGEGRTRVAFALPVRVTVQLDLVSGWAAVQMATNRIGEGYECRITRDRHVQIAINQARGKPQPGERPAAPPPIVLARTENAVFPAGKEAATLSCEATETSIAVWVGEREVLRADLPEDIPFKSGNVALRSSAKAYWDDVSITGPVSAAWLEDRLFIALSLLSKDMYEADNSWTTARELLAGVGPQARTFHPDGDIDWIAVAVPRGVRFVRVVLYGERFGIAPIVNLIEPDGVTPIPDVKESKTMMERSYLVPVEDRPTFYVRISEADGRRGTYDLMATVVGRQPTQ